MDADLKHQSADQPIRQQNHDQSNLNSGFGYSSEDPYFYQDTNTAFNNAWDSTILDPSLHPEYQSHQNWAQPSQQPLPNSGYASPFGTNQAYGSYNTYQNNSYSNVPPEAFSAPLTYPNGPVLQQPAFSHPPGPSFVGTNALSGATIAPSAIQSYPSAFERFSPHSDRTSTPLQTETLSTAAAANLRPGNFYDENVSEVFASKVPSGRLVGALAVKNSDDLCKATGSSRSLVHLYATNDALESDEPRVIFPRITSRKSLKDVKRDVLEYQNGRPWDPSQKAVAKKLRIKLTPGKRGRPRKDASTANFAVVVPAFRSTASTPTEMVDVDSSSESSAEESDDDSATEESEYEEPSPLPKQRPTEPKAALEYDVIKSIWARRDTMLSGAVIKSALSEYLEIVKSIRETFKSSSAALATAEAAKSASGIENAKAAATTARDSMQHVLQATSKHGHPDIVERFGSSPLLISIFYTFLLDRFNKSDYNGALSESILKLLAACTTLNQDLLEKTRFDKILPRFVRKGNETMKKLAQQILDKAASMSKPKVAESKDSNVEETAKKPLLKSVSVPDPAVVKRSKLGESTAAQPVKKSSQPAPPRAGPVGLSSKPTQSSIKSATAKPASMASADLKASMSASKVESPPRSRMPPVKPPSLLSGLKSASKKSVTSSDAPRATVRTDSTAVKQDPPKPIVTKAPSASTAAPKSTFSFSQALADLGKPKPTQESKQSTKDRPPETEEERQKRERKEARRKLRVTFKPAESLEEIRYFHHDPDEDQGHDRSQLRGVSDMKDEGRMLKLYSQRVDLDEEEEYEPQFDEDELIAWHAPTRIDLSDADYNATMSNFVTRGGTMEVESSERAVQEQHERNTLIAIYPSLSDIPPTPREPADPYSGPTSQEVAFGPPTDEIRSRESQFYAQRSKAPVTASAGSSDIDAILRALNANAPSAPNPYAQASTYTQMPGYQQPPSQPSIPTNNIESIFAQFSQTSAASAPAPQQSSLDPSIQAALSIFSSQLQPGGLAPQSQAQPSVPDIYAQQPQSTPGFPQSGGSQDLGAILSQISSMQNIQGGDRKRPFEGVDPYSQDAKRNKGGLYKYKTQPCRFYKEGTCKKGDACTFQHE